MAESDGLTPRDAAAQVAGLVADACGDRGRHELATSVRALLEQLDRPARVVVTGEFKQGKSSLLNVLCGHQVCPVDDDVATAVPTIVHYGDEPKAAAIFASESVVTIDGSVRQPLAFEDLPAWIREDGTEVATAGLAAIEAAVPSTLLRSGLSLVDMPGTGGMATPRAAMALSAILPTCDAAIVVSDAGQPLTITEAEHIDALRARVDDVFVAKTKIDIHPSWTRVVATDEALLRSYGVPVAGVSAELAHRARRTSDRQLAIESRLPPLSAWLQLVVASTRDRLALDLADASIDVCAQLAAPLEQEAATLRDPAGHAARAAQLEAAAEEATRLRGVASRWQQVMNDAVADLTNEVSDALRARFRALLSAAEDEIDQLDPAIAWVEFEPAFRRRVTAAATEHELEVHDRLVSCAGRVEAVFTEEEAAVDQLIPSVDADTSQRASSAIAVKELKKPGVGSRAMGAVRASYSGAVLTGFVTGVLGLTLAAPLALAAGAAVGYRGIREDSRKQLAQRQAQAKAAVRAYVDELAGALSKETRDTVRRTQRALRDHFTSRAEELVRSAAASLDSARKAAALADQEANDRLGEVSGELAHVHAVRDLAAKTRVNIAVVIGAVT